MVTNNFDSLLKYLPHKEAMLLIDSVEHVDAHSAKTISCFDGRRAVLRPLDQVWGDYHGIELIAQSAALPLIFSAKAEEVHQGMIIQVKSFRSNGLTLKGALVLKTDCEVELLLDGTLASVVGRVFNEDLLCCEAVLTLALTSAKDG